MAFVKKQPAQIVSAYEECEIEIMSDKALYDWATAHKNDTDGINIALDNGVANERPVGNTTMGYGEQLLPIYMYPNALNNGSTIIRNANNSQTFTFRPDTTYSLSFDRVIIQGLPTGNELQTGNIDLIVDQECAAAGNGGDPPDFSAFQTRVSMPVQQLATTEQPNMQPLGVTFKTGQIPANQTGWRGVPIRAHFMFNKCTGLHTGWQIGDDAGKIRFASIPAVEKNLAFFIVFSIAPSQATSTDTRNIIGQYGNSLRNILNISGPRLQLAGGIDIALPLSPGGLYAAYICMKTSPNSATTVRWAVSEVGGVTYAGETSVIITFDPSQSTAYYIGQGTIGYNAFDGVVYSFKIFDCDWSFNYVKRNLFADPLGVVVPRALTSAAPDRGYGKCIGEWWPWLGNYESSPTSIYSSIYDGTNTIAAYPYLVTNFTFVNKFPNDSISSLNGITTQLSVYTQGAMLNKGAAIPYMPSPSYVSSSSDSTLPTLTVNISDKSLYPNQVSITPVVNPITNIARINLSPFLRSWFEEQEEAGDGRIRYLRMLQNYYTITGLPEVTNAIAGITIANDGPRYFMRHISQYGHISDREKFGIAVLSSEWRRAGTVTAYPGYPLDIAVNTNIFDAGHISQPVAVAWHDTTDVSTFTQAGVAVLKVSDGITHPNGFQFFEVEQTTYVFSRQDIQVLEGCTPPRPFYVRWVNALGGYDYYMFGNRMTIEDEISDITNTERYPDSQYHVWHRVSATGRRRVIVSTGLFPIEQWPEVSFIPRSPLVQWYDEAAAAWQNIIFDDSATIERDTDSGTCEIEYTFTLPPLRLQQI